MKHSKQSVTKEVYALLNLGGGEGRVQSPKWRLHEQSQASLLLPSKSSSRDNFAFNPLQWHSTPTQEPVHCPLQGIRGWELIFPPQIHSLCTQSHIHFVLHVMCHSLYWKLSSFWLLIISLFIRSNQWIKCLLCAKHCFSGCRPPQSSTPFTRKETSIKQAWC